jgi:hypothetical protein
VLAVTRDADGLEVDVNTFRGHLKLATLDNLDGIDGLIAREGLCSLDFLDNFVAFEDFAEDDVAAIKPTVDSMY